MKLLSSVFFVIILLTGFFSCQKQDYFKSESDVKEALQGTWTLIPIPRYDSIFNPDGSFNSAIVHFETWTFNDTKVIIVNGSQTASSTYSVKTTISKSEFKLDNIEPKFTYPSRVREINGTWRIVELEDDVLVIANDQEGTTGLLQLDFQR